MNTEVDNKIGEASREKNFDLKKLSVSIGPTPQGAQISEEVSSPKTTRNLKKKRSDSETGESPVRVISKVVGYNQMMH